jgi:glutamate dehydrogenase
VFAIRAQEDTSADPAAIARAYTIAREVFAARDLWARIETLDNRVPASVQYSMLYQTSRLLRHMTYWFLADRNGHLDIDARVSRLRPGVLALDAALPGVLAGADLERHRKRCAELAAAGVSDKIARQIANLSPLNASLDIVEIAKAAQVEVAFAARVYFGLGDALALDWLRDQIERLAVEGHWQAVARGALRENLYSLQRRLVSAALAQKRPRKADPTAVIDAWLERRRSDVEHLRQSLKEMRTGGAAADFPTLSVALQALRRLTPA